MKNAAAMPFVLALALSSASVLAQSQAPSNTQCPTQQPPAPAQPACPLSDGQIDAEKSHTLFLYYPTTKDFNFPYPYVPAFDAANLNPALTGSTQALIETIHAVVADDYCEFNVQVRNTTTDPDTWCPATNTGTTAGNLCATRPGHYATVAIGTDVNGTYWGKGPDTPEDPGHARVWAGYYAQCEGGSYNPATNAVAASCPATGELSGANATVPRWAQAIGGTAAHEGGHTYGLAHTDEDPQNVADEPNPLPPLAGEDYLNRHLMPAGEYINAGCRANYRRHFGDRTYGLLADKVGLTVQTMYNWDLVNPNQAAGYSLSIDFLSAKPTVSLQWSYDGDRSPWKLPVVTDMGMKGKLYAHRITWSTPNPAYAGTVQGMVAGGATFHIGATFTGVDFNQPDPIVVDVVTLYNRPSNGQSTPLVLHPRLPSFDTGTVDANGHFVLDMYMPQGGAPLQLKSARLYQLPRVASIDSMIGSGNPRSFDGLPITPWRSVACAPGSLADGRRCLIGNKGDRPHVLVEHHLGEPGVVDCGLPPVRLRPPRWLPPIRLKLPEATPPPSANDRSEAPDEEGPICAGVRHDPFPSTTVYLVATFVDPKAHHYSRPLRHYITGPVTSKVFYQFAGVRDATKLWDSAPVLPVLPTDQ